jgi:hypothetical protein
MTITAIEFHRGTVAYFKACASQQLQEAHEPTNCMQKFAHLVIGGEK